VDVAYALAPCAAQLVVEGDDVERDSLAHARIQDLNRYGVASSCVRVVGGMTDG
jgi:hypothetical protein